MTCLAAPRTSTLWLVSTANFQNKLLETNYSNNWAAVKIQINGTSVTELETKFPS